jgi:hypothetical protein
MPNAECRERPLPAHRLPFVIRHSVIRHWASPVIRHSSFIRSFVILSFVISFGSAFAAGNLVLNGGFEQGDKHPDYWFVKLTDFFDKDQHTDPPSHKYICACGEDLGSMQPFVGLLCPKCKGFLSGDECGAWYAANDKCVSLDNGPHGKCLKFSLPKDVGENQGVRVFSSMIQAKRGWGYVLDLDVKTAGSLARVFVEGYRYYSAKSTFVWTGGYAPTFPKNPVERKYRCPVNCGSSPNWQHFTREFSPPKNYQIDFMSVKLYAYMPGEAWYDNVSLRLMTEKEMSQFLSSAPKAKDKRFER